VGSAPVRRAVRDRSFVVQPDCLCRRAAAAVADAVSPTSAAQPAGLSITSRRQRRAWPQHPCRTAAEAAAASLAAAPL